MGFECDDIVLRVIGKIQERASDSLQAWVLGFCYERPFLEAEWCGRSVLSDQNASTEAASLHGHSEINECLSHCQPYDIVGRVNNAIAEFVFRLLIIQLPDPIYPAEDVIDVVDGYASCGGE